MKILKITMILFALLTVTANAKTSAAGETVLINQETPAKTVVIKGPVSDANKLFAETKTLSFEIYKAGDLNKMIEKMKSVKGVQNVSPGTVNGDYSMVTVTLAANKDKAFWGKMFTGAGLTHIKINNNPIVEIEKM